MAWAERVVEAKGPDGRGAVVLDGAVQDDAAYEPCSLVLQLARDLPVREPELAAAYGMTGAR